MNLFLFEVTGKDSKRYLNSRLTNDINKLQDYQLSFMLSPQGKIEGQLFVYPLEDKYLMFASGEQEEVLKNFKRFIVADRVSVSIVNLQLQAIDDGSSELVYSEQEIRLSNTFLGKEKIFTFSIGNKIDFDFDLRFEYNQPIYPNELNDILLPEVAIPDCIAANKGCYVGQEVVERVLAIGKVPSVVKRVDFNVEVKPKDRFFDSDKRLVGEVLSLDKTGKKAFARVKNSYQEQIVYLNDNLGKIL